MTVALKQRYHPEVKSADIPLLDAKMKACIKDAIETRLATEPQHYGAPLRKTLHSYWKLRVGDYRIAVKIVGKEDGFSAWYTGRRRMKLSSEKRS